MGRKKKILLPIGKHIPFSTFLKEMTKPKSIENRSIKNKAVFPKSKSE